MRKRVGARGFTLVELSIVVVIVGILATLAVVGYRRLINGSHATEAHTMLQSIRVAQESYRAESGSYANLGTTLCPAAAPGRFKTQWNPACNGGTATWAALPVHSDGPVMYGYYTIAGTPTTAVPAMTLAGQSIAWPTGSALTTDWFVAYAQGDVDGDGVQSKFMASSFSNAITVEAESE